MTAAIRPYSIAEKPLLLLKTLDNTAHILSPIYYSLSTLGFLHGSVNFELRAPVSGTFPQLVCDLLDGISKALVARYVEQVVDDPLKGPFFDVSAKHFRDFADGVVSSGHGA